MRVVVSADYDHENGYILTDDLRRRGGYEGEEITLKLLNDLTLDDIDSLSVWCVPLGTRFTDYLLLVLVDGEWKISAKISDSLGAAAPSE